MTQNDTQTLPKSPLGPHFTYHTIGFVNRVASIATIYCYSMHLDVFLRYCHHLFRDTTDQSCHGVLQRDANKLSSEYRWQYSFAAAVGAKPCRIRRGTAIPCPSAAQSNALAIPLPDQWYNCHTIAIQLP